MKDDQWIVWVFVAFLGVCVAFAFLMLQVTLMPVVASLALLWFGGVTVYHYASESRRILGDRTRAGITLPAPRRREDQSSEEPAFLAYPIRQLWQDLATIGDAAWRETRDAAEDAFDRLKIGVAPVVILFPLMAAAVLGGVVGIAGAYLLIAVLLTVFAMAGAVVWLAAWGLVVAMESVLMLWRGIRQSCPYADCYRRIALPGYDCSACQQLHRRLLPNKFGLLRHDCRCGTSLSTTVLFGRHRGAAVAVCPHCDRRLPRRIGRVPIVTVPVVGGPAAGKSTLICLSVDSMRRTLDDAGARMSFAEQSQRAVFESARAALRDGGSVGKTVQRMPDGMMVDLELGGRADRILYIFDPAGESYVDAEGVEAQGYLDHAEGLLIVVDPLALDGVVRVLTPAERDEVKAAVGGDEGMHGLGSPDVIVGRLLDLLRSRSRLSKLRRIAVVVSKADALVDLAVGRDLRDAAEGVTVRTWLEQVGWGNNVRLLEQSAPEIRYYRSGLNMDSSPGADPFLWLGAVRPAAARRASESPESAARAISGGLPRGYRSGRKTLYATSIAAAVLSALMILTGGIAGAMLGGMTSARVVLAAFSNDSDGGGPEYDEDGTYPGYGTYPEGEFETPCDEATEC